MNKSINDQVEEFEKLVDVKSIRHYLPALVKTHKEALEERDRIARSEGEKRGLEKSQEVLDEMMQQAREEGEERALRSKYVQNKLKEAREEERERIKKIFRKMVEGKKKPLWANDVKKHTANIVRHNTIDEILASLDEYFKV